MECIRRVSVIVCFRLPCLFCLRCLTVLSLSHEIELVGITTSQPTEASELKLFAKLLCLFDVMSKPIPGIMPNDHAKERERGRKIMYEIISDFPNFAIHLET